VLKGTLNRINLQTVFCNSMLYGYVRFSKQQVQLFLKRMATNRAVNSTGLRGLQVLGTGANELSPSLFLFTDTQRYLFNCSENTTRFCTEHKLRIAKMKNVFVTELCWEKMGGYCGLAMTQKDIGVTGISLHGPTNTDQFVAACKRLLGEERIDVLESTETIYKDENITVEGIEIFPSDIMSGSSSDELSGEDREAKEPPAKKVQLPKRVHSVMAYICKLADTPGKFNPLRAKELGLKPGPLYAQLKNGKSVESPDGKTILPSDVLGTPIEGPKFVIIDCPTVDYLNSVTTNPTLSACGQSTLIVHIVPWEVLNTGKYCKFASSFGPDCQHLLLHSEVCPPEISFRDAFKVQYPLSVLDPTTYHLPSVGAPPSLVLDPPFNTAIVGRCLLKYDLSCKKMGWKKEGVLPALTADEIQRPLREIITPDNQNFVEYTETIKKRMDDEKLSLKTSGGAASNATPQPKASSDGDNMKVTFLGTGSAMPTKYRNVTGIIVHTPQQQGMFLDCGEGSVSQLYRCFGQPVAEEMIMKLCCVFISHMHADHHLGLCRLLTLRKKLLRKNNAYTKKLLVIGPAPLQYWLGRYSKLSEKLHFNFVDSASLTNGEISEDFGVNLADLGFTKCLTVPVVHMSRSYGVCLTHCSGHKIVYSGDTRPCAELVTAGTDATLLIHEATFEDNLQSEAEIKKHSTTGEALEISKKMNARFTLLTHFSQRYPKITTDQVESDYHGNKAAVTFDCMSVCLGNLDKLPRQLPYIRDIFNAIGE